MALCKMTFSKLKCYMLTNSYVGSNPDATVTFYRKIPTLQASYTTNLYYFLAINQIGAF